LKTESIIIKEQIWITGILTCCTLVIYEHFVIQWLTAINKPTHMSKSLSYVLTKITPYGKLFETYYHLP